MSIKVQFLCSFPSFLTIQTPRISSPASEAVTLKLSDVFCRYIDAMGQKSPGTAGQAKKQYYDAREYDSSFDRWMDDNGYSEQRAEYLRSHPPSVTQASEPEILVNKSAGISEDPLPPHSKLRHFIGAGIRYCIAGLLFIGSFELYRHETTSPEALNADQAHALRKYPISPDQIAEYSRAMGLTQGKDGDFYFLVRHPESGLTFAIIQGDPTLDNYHESPKDRYRSIIQHDDGGFVMIQGSATPCGVIFDPLLKPGEKPIENGVDWEFDFDQVPPGGIPVMLFNPLAAEAGVTDARIMRNPYGEGCILSSKYSSNHPERNQAAGVLYAPDRGQFIGYVSGGLVTPMKLIDQKTAHLWGYYQQAQ